VFSPWPTKTHLPNLISQSKLTSIFLLRGVSRFHQQSWSFNFISFNKIIIHFQSYLYYYQLHPEVGHFLIHQHESVMCIRCNLLNYFNFFLYYLFISAHMQKYVEKAFEKPHSAKEKV